jgi:8-oxo-dGTP diphosphatase
MPEPVNEGAVRDHRARLCDRYDTGCVEATEEVGDGRFADLHRLSREGYIGAAYALVTRAPGQAAPLTGSMGHAHDERERALLILHRGGDHWTVPGGGREAGEEYEETVVREVREETGITCAVEDCLRVEHRETVTPDHPEVLHTLWAVFEVEYVEGSVAIQPGELNGAAWFAEPPERRGGTVEHLLAEWTNGE